MMAMPGADMAIGYDGDVFGHYHAPLLHYRSMLKSGRAARVMEQVPEWRQWSGLAICDEFQPPCQLLAYQETGLELKTAKFIVPLCDLLTFWLTGVKGMDPVMHQSQGLAHPDAPRIYNKLFGQGVHARINSGLWNVFDEYKLIEQDGIYYGPVTHDSPFNRRNGIWTGTWVGTDLRLPCKLSELDLSKAEEGLAIEGVGHTAAVISNVAFAGRAWKQLMISQGFADDDFAGAANYALATLELARDLDLTQMPRDDTGEKSAAWVKEQLPPNKPEGILASFIFSVATACRQKIEATASFLGIDVPTDINVAGGWSQNVAFLASLALFGFNPSVPPHGANATSRRFGGRSVVALPPNEGLHLYLRPGTQRYPRAQVTSANDKNTKEHHGRTGPTYPVGSFFK